MVLIHPEIVKREGEALCDLFHALDGCKWKRNDGWLKFDRTMDQKHDGMGLAWYGTKWENGHIISIDLQNNNLKGNLPDIFNKLKKLKILKLNNNLLLKGKVPISLYKLKYLKYLYLNDTQLYDILPSKEAYNLHLIRYKNDFSATFRFHIGTCQWIADISEQEMFFISSSLLVARTPHHQKDIKLTAHNATGPERMEAATKLQGIYRGKIARRKFQELLKSIYECHVDPETGYMYYIDTRNGNTTWEKPDILNHIKITKKIIPNNNLKKNIWEEKYDTEGNKYYWNSKTNESTWEIISPNPIEQELIRRYGEIKSIEEIFQCLFDEYDQDKTGFIDENELVMICADLGTPFKQSQIHQMLADFPTKNKGVLNVQELQQWLQGNFIQ